MVGGISETKSPKSTMLARKTRGLKQNSMLNGSHDTLHF